MIYITDDNFYKLALSKLKTKYISEAEFKSLLKHIVYIKRLLKKYISNAKCVNINLLINHFIILYNEFDIDFMSSVLFYQINPLYYPQVKTILLLLNKINESDKFLINDYTIDIQNIKKDTELEKLLKTIF